MVEISSKWVEDTVGKGEIARYEQFPLFPHCFQRLLLQTRKHQGLLRKGLNAINHFPNKPLFFMSLQYKSFENTVGKGEIARSEQFLLFSNRVFLPFSRTFLHFHQIGNRHLQTLSVWRRTLKFVIWEKGQSITTQCHILTH